MSQHTFSPAGHARRTGWLYLSLVPLVIVSTLILPSDAVATPEAVLAAEWRWRAVIALGLVFMVVNTVLALSLYRILGPASRPAATMMAAFYLLAVPVAVVNELNRVAVLLLSRSVLGGGPPATDLVPLFTGLHAAGIDLAYVFYGLWLLPMGYAVIVSGYLPRVLGILLVVAGVGYVVRSFLTVLAPAVGTDVLAILAVGELAFPLWLVIRAVDVPRWNERSGMPA